LEVSRKGRPREIGASAMACLAFPAECEYTVYMEAQERQTVNSKEYDPTENDGMHRDLFERSSIVQAVLDWKVFRSQ